MAREGKTSFLSAIVGGAVGAAAAVVVLGGLAFWALTAPDEDEQRPTPEQVAKYGSGDIDELPEHLVSGCGKYFARHGTHIVFRLVERQEGRNITDAVFVVDLPLLKIVLDDTLSRPFARSVDPAGRRPGVEVKISSKDFQQARCLSVHTQTSL